MLSSALWIDFSIGSFKEFQQALLNTVARNISGDRWVGTLPCNLVDFVEEDDAMLSGFRIHVCSLEETGDDAVHIFAHIACFGKYPSLIHITEPTRLRRISYDVFCLKKKN